MSFTQAALDELRRSDWAVAWLARVYLSEPSTRTLHLAMTGFDTPDGRTWEAAITNFGDIDAPGSAFSSGVDDVATAAFRMASRAALGFQESGKNITNLFSDFRWQGARVEIMAWPLRSTNANDLTRMYVGQVQTYQVGPDECEVILVQRDDWNRQVSPIVISRDRFPRAPEKSLGAAVPVVYGKIGVPMRAPWGPLDGYNMERVFGIQMGVPAVCVDSGRGGSGEKQKFLVASHAIKSHQDPSTDSLYSVRDVDKLVPVEATALVNDDNGAGFALGDAFKSAFYPIAPTDPNTGVSNPCDNPRYAGDPFEESTFAKFVYQPSPLIDKRRMEWRLPAVNPPGRAVNVRLVAGYKSSAALTNFKIGIKSLTTGFETNQTVSASTTPALHLGSGIMSGENDWDGAIGLPGSPWNFMECLLLAWWDSVPGALQQVWLYFIGLEVQYYPDSRIWTAAQKPKVKLQKGRHRHEQIRAAHLFPDHAPQIFGKTEGVPADTESDAPFFGTIEGFADDASGTYTGAANALIERAPDIARHLLETFGNQGGLIETDPGLHGNFVSPRTTDKTWRQTTRKHGIQIAERSDVKTALEELAESSLATCIIDRFSDRMLWLPWREGAGTAYPRGVYLDDLRSFPDIDHIDSKRVPAGIAVKYGWDGNAKRLLHTTHCAQDGSTSGHFYRGLRDERFKVAANVNDRLVLVRQAGGSQIGAGVGQVLPVGDYTDAEFLQVLYSFLDDQLGAGNPSAAYGGLIVENVNDVFEIKYGIGTFISCTIPAGRYSMEEMAAALEAALEAADGGASWTVSYNRTTQKFTLTRAGGNFTIWCGGNSHSAAASYGFDHSNAVAGSTVVSQFAIDEELVAFSFDQAYSVPVASGTYGSESASHYTASDVIGFDPRIDRDFATYHVSDCYKGHLELLLEAGARSYGYTRDLTREHRATYDTDTARDGRNRLVNWWREPRLVMRFATWRMPDLQRGHVVTFPDMDDSGVAYPKRGSNGSWIGKTFRVMSVIQKAGTSTDQVVECIENDALPLIERPVPGLGGYGSIDVAGGGAIVFGDVAMPV